jgi:TonB family protein
MTWWQYLLLVNIYLVLFYGFYAVLLRSETFFNLNRGYLVASALLSFIIPLIHYEWISNLFITQRVQHTISVYAQPIQIYHLRRIEPHDITIGGLIFAVYTAGTAILLLRLVWQLISLRRIINEPGETGAFSFFKSIRLGNAPENQDVIAEHERVHASQWHSADIMLIEAIAIINWFNPIVYFYKLGIKHIHEYIADKQALKNGTTKAEYALLLLSQTLKAPSHQLVTQFNNSSLLRRRIMMLQKNRSRYRALVKYGLSAPLFLLMLVLSSAAVIKNHTIKFFNSKAEEVMMSPAPEITLTESKPHIATSPRHPVNKVIVPEETGERYPALESGGEKGFSSDPVLLTAEQAPAFRGGMLGFYKFLAGNLRYPDAMMRHNVQGKVVVEMTVEKDGSLSDFKSLKDIGSGSAEEAIRVLKLSPKWIPGYQNGQPVRVRYTLPILFNLVSVKNEPDTITKVSYTVKDEDAVAPVTERIVGNADTINRKYNMIMANDFDFQSDAVFILDGKIVPNINSVDPAEIRTLKVIKHVSKDDSYYVQYGPKSLNGIVVIELKSH